MKKLFAGLVAFCVLVLSPLVSFAAAPAAAGLPSNETSTVQTLPDDITVVTTITYENAGNIRSMVSTHSGHKTNRYYHGSEYVGSVTIYGTVTYTGSAAWATAVSGGHSTANSWAYGSEVVSYGGGTAYLTSSLNGITCPVDLSLTCSVNGTLS